MKKLLFSMIIVGIATMVHGQHVPTVTTASYEMGGVINFESIDDPWQVHLQHLEAPGPGTNNHKARLKAKKASVAKRFPRSGKPRHVASSNKSGGIPVPEVGAGFDPGPAQGTPNDNDVAFGGGKVVSVVNTRIRILDTAGDLLESQTLGGFVSVLGLPGGKFDPKIVFDPNSQRFICVFLSGNTWETSNIAVCFSQTSDPEGDWNAYGLNGNPIDNETWSDYPVIGISEDELFIGINTFENGSMNNSGFVETCLWQIGLEEGYAGQALNTAYYSDILEGDKEIFNICPIQGGLGLYGPDQYLLASRSFDEQNDTIFLLHVTGNLDDPTRELDVTVLQTPEEYVMPVTAPQPVNHEFDTNDNRVLGGFYHNGNIQWVQATTDTVTGTSAILHGTIHDVATAPTVTTAILSDTVVYYGYPNISCTGAVDIDEQAIITFNFTGDTINPGMSAIYYTTAGEYSEELRLKEGEGPVNVLSSTEERWGDYSGTQLDYDERGHLWVAGSYGKSSGSHGTWVTELWSPDQSLNIEPTDGLINALVFPNPAPAAFTVEFWVDDYTDLDFRMFDEQGREVAQLLQHRASPGRSRLSFNTSHLAAGIYFMNAMSAGKVVVQERIVVE